MTKRIISSAVGIAIGIAVLFFIDTPVINIVLALFSVLGTYELLKADKCIEYKAVTAVAFVYSAVSPFLYALDNAIASGTIGNSDKINDTVLSFNSYHGMFTVAAVLAMLSCYLLVHKKMAIEKLYYSVAVTVFLSYALNSIYTTYKLSDRHGIAYVLLILCGAWIADSAAYFVGTFLGKRKLCPDISPKKTIEGFIGGVIINGLFMIAFNLVYVKFFAVGCSVNYFSSFFLGIICALIGTVGDLSASLIKRQCGIKDFGKLMPGHGGFMDRFDSVLFVAPFMYAFLSIFKIYI